MNLLLLKALGIALTLSQIISQPEVKTSFNPQTDRAEVRRILHEGCGKVFQILNQISPALGKQQPDKLLEMLIKNAALTGQSTKIFGFEMADGKAAYDLFCKDGVSNEQTDKILTDVIGYYNLTMFDLPDVSTISIDSLRGFSTVQDGDGNFLTDLFRSSRREIVPLAKIPKLVQNAFLAAEDQDFYSHPGVDAAGVIRAGMSNLMKMGTGKREQGGSTITQQLVKNMLLSNEVTYERKMREMVLAYKLEKALGKDRVLELYLNYPLEGCSAWGVSMGAKAHFGKTLEELGPAEAAFLAGMPKGAAAYNPDRYPEASRDRTLYVLGQMKLAKFITPEQYEQGVLDVKDIVEGRNGKRIKCVQPTIAYGGHLLDEVVAQTKKQVGLDPRETPMQISTTVNPAIQRGTEEALRAGLRDFEIRTGRAKFGGAEANLGEKIAKLKAYDEAQAAKAASAQTNAEPAVTKPVSKDPLWLRALKAYSPKLRDVTAWETAVVLEGGKGKATVGTKDGQSYTLTGGPKGAVSSLKVYDVVYVTTAVTKKGGRTAELQFAPEVQGAVLVMENATGRIVSMAGGFSHSLSSWNRAVDMVRQPGSLAKPLTYLAALMYGLQPNTLVYDSTIELEPIGGKGRRWSPNNYDSSGGDAVVTMAKGLADSRNRVTARIAAGLNKDNHDEGLAYIMGLMKECGFNENPIAYWPVILGSQETSLPRIAACYAAMANGGLRPNPHVIRQATQGDRLVISEQSVTPTPMRMADANTTFQLRTMLQGVVARGTAAGLNKTLQDVVGKGRLSDYLAGKTGTSQGSNDTWFAGFTQDLTFVVWVGYDNGTGAKRRNLGDGTGGSVAAPIFANVLRTTVERYPLRKFKDLGPAQQQSLIALDVGSDGNLYHLGEGGSDATVQYIRLDNGEIRNTRDTLLQIDPPPYDPNSQYSGEQQDQYNEDYFPPPPGQDDGWGRTHQGSVDYYEQPVRRVEPQPRVARRQRTYQEQEEYNADAVDQYGQPYDELDQENR